jgi:hypothetical protein
MQYQIHVKFIVACQPNCTTIAGVPGISGNDSTLLNMPRGLALDSQLNLYVADTKNNRIQRFPHY